MGGNLGMMSSGGSAGSMPSMPSMPGAGFGNDAPTVPGYMRPPAPGGGPLTPGSGGQMTPTFGSLAPLAGMFMNNQPAGGMPPRAPSSGFNVSPAPIQQPMPNPNPAWQDLPTQPPLPTPAPAPDPAAARPQAPGNWAAQFMGQIGDTPYGAGNAMAKLQGWNQSNPQGVQRWIDAGHVPPLRGGNR